MTGDQLKKRILALAVQGKLVPQNPADEPADALLERIRKEKRKLLKEGKLKKYAESRIYKGEDGKWRERVAGKSQDDEVAVPFELPAGWAWARIKDVADTQTGTTPPTNDKNNFGDYIPFIKPGDIFDGKIFYNCEWLSEQGLLKGRLIPRGSVIMVCIGGSIGKCALADRDITCNQQINTATPYKGILAQYLYFYMQSPFFYRLVRVKSSGTAVPIIKKSSWESALIPIPPLPEQRRIAERVAALFEQIAAIDEGAANLERLFADFKKRALTFAIEGKLVPQDPADEPADALLKRIRAEKRKLLKECKLKKYAESRIYKGEDGKWRERVAGKKQDAELAVPFELPAGWAWARLGEIVHNHGQKTPCERFSYIDIGSIDNANQKLNVRETIIEPDKAPSRARKIVKQGDILYSTVRPYLHNMCIVDKEFSCEPIASTGFAVLAVEPGIVNAFLFYYMLSPVFDSYANKPENSRGTAYPAINDTILYKALVPVPPLEEQKRIADKVAALFAAIDSASAEEAELSHGE